jgi:hypothetical protein
LSLITTKITLSKIVCPGMNPCLPPPSSASNNINNNMICIYYINLMSLRLELSVMDTIGTMGLKYGLTFPSYIGIIILLVLSHQFSQLANSTNDDCSIYHNSLPSLFKIVKILVVSICLMTFV